MTGRYRVEEDSLGSVRIPSDAYYGVRTERARQNFAVSGQTLGDQRSLVAAIAQVKKAAALANLDVGVLREPVADAICQAADEVISGLLGREQFPVDVLSPGGGVAPDVNVNEVLANRANELLSGRRGYDFVHPANHVAAGQSTSDCIATAVNIALHQDIVGLGDAMKYLGQVLEQKAEEYADTVKPSHAGLTDSVPVTYGQAFGAYLAVIDRAVNRLGIAADSCLDVPMGGAEVGTGLGVGASYLEHIYPRLRESTGLPLRRHPNFFDAFQNGDVYQYASAIFKTLACGLVKVAKDLRILAGHDRVRGGELRLPQVEAATSFLPEVNPVMADLVVQVGFQVCGNDAAVTMAVESAELDFNTWNAVIAKNLFDSAGLLTNAMPLFADRCLRGIEVDTERGRRTAEASLKLSAVVSGVYGNDAGARAAHYARTHEVPIKEAVVRLGIAPREVAERLLDPVLLANPQRSAALLDTMVAEQRARTAELVRGLSSAVRLAIYQTTVAVARADSVICRQEEQALTVVAEALGLTAAISLPPEQELPDELGKLNRSERELVYACAAWLAGADSVTDVAEAELLELLAAKLHLDEETAESLRSKVDALRTERREYVPRADQLPWWEEFGTLLHRLHDRAVLPS